LVPRNLFPNDESTESLTKPTPKTTNSPETNDDDCPPLLRPNFFGHDVIYSHEDSFFHPNNNQEINHTPNKSPGNIPSKLPSIETIIQDSQSIISSLETSHESSTLVIEKERLQKLETVEREMERVRSILYKNSTRTSNESKSRSETSDNSNKIMSISASEYKVLKKKANEYTELKKKQLCRMIWYKPSGKNSLHSMMLEHVEQLD